MSWQLWVLIAAVVAAMVGLFVLKLRHAQEVFDEIVAHPETPTSDEVARHRLARTPATPTRQRLVSHHPHVAGHRRHR
ncbi:hypothetical protein [Kribbella sp. NPDC006257]|uniref:hypothetical protein n=1 Tax=Kribbella sp. NPDC006257 TaxID=3156738 RepID=UPI0033A46328